MVRLNSIDNMHSGNMWFSWSKSSNYQEKLRCHACDGRTEDGKWKIGQCSIRPETAIDEGGVVRVLEFPKFVLKSHKKPTLCGGNSLFESLSHQSGTFPSKSVYWGSFPSATTPILSEQDGDIKSYFHDIPIETVVWC